MKECPILFSAPMVRAILDGRKTQTRRIVKPEPPSVEDVRRLSGSDFSIFTDDCAARPGDFRVAGPVWAVRDLMGQEPWWRSPYGAPGDRLWVRETWQAWNCVGHEYDEWDPITREVRMGEPWSEWIEQRGRPDAIEYLADGKSNGPWTPSIHMPRWASRIDLEITEVRVERLHDISGEDARAEGIQVARCEVCARSSSMCPADASSHIMEFADLWRDINGDESWGANPWVWAIAFRRVRP